MCQQRSTQYLLLIFVTWELLFNTSLIFGGIIPDFYRGQKANIFDKKKLATVGTGQTHVPIIQLYSFDAQS